MLNDLLSARTGKLPVPLPNFGKRVIAVVRHFHTKGQRYAILKTVDEDDHSWVSDDDGSELAHEWDVISWKYLPDLEVF